MDRRGVERGEEAFLPPPTSLRRPNETQCNKIENNLDKPQLPTLQGQQPTGTTLLEVEARAEGQYDRHDDGGLHSQAAAKKREKEEKAAAEKKVINPLYFHIHPSPRATRTHTRAHTHTHSLSLYISPSHALTHTRTHTGARGGGGQEGQGARGRDAKQDRHQEDEA